MKCRPDVEEEADVVDTDVVVEAVDMVVEVAEEHHTKPARTVGLLP